MAVRKSAAKKTKRVKRSGGTKEEILDRARDLYLEHGATGISMRRIAAEVGVTPMAIYRHFENKEALQRELLARGFQTFGTYLQPALEGKDPRERLRLTAEGYLNFALEQSKYFELIFLSIDPLNDLKLSEVIREQSLPTFQFLVDRVRECIKAGIFKKDRPASIALSLLAQCTGLCALYLSGSFQWSEEDMMREFRASLRRTFAGYLVEP